MYKSHWNQGKMHAIDGISWVRRLKCSLNTDILPMKSVEKVVAVVGRDRPIWYILEQIS